MSGTGRVESAGLRPLGGRPVVVGVDGSPGATQALAWAAGDAVRRRRPLRLVTVFPAHGVCSEFILTDGAEDARRAAPEVSVSSRVLKGDVVEALLRAGRDAEILVVGHRGLNAVMGLFLGTVSAAVAARSQCPTVVVRGSRTSSEGDPVVVGVDGTPACDAAVGFAFAAAERDAVPLVAVHVGRDAPGDRGGSPSLEDDASALTTAPDEPKAALLAECLAGRRGAHPDVEVVRLLPAGRPVVALVEQSACARLLVVGSPRRTKLGWLTGSVGQAVLRQAHCPVAVVPSGAPTVPAVAVSTSAGDRL
jgi:nucleotide-binding universal stress UspA family protein